MEYGLRPFCDTDSEAIHDPAQQGGAHVMVSMGPAWTYVEDDVPLMAGGVVQYWPGVGHAWAVLSEEMRGRPVVAVRVAMRVFSAYLVPEFHRIEALVPADFPHGVRFVRKLGFKLESVAYKYGPDKATYLRYVYLRGW